MLDKLFSFKFSNSIRESINRLVLNHERHHIEYEKMREIHKRYWQQHFHNYEYSHHYGHRRTNCDRNGNRNTNNTPSSNNNNNNTNNYNNTTTNNSNSNTNSNNNNTNNNNNNNTGGFRFRDYWFSQHNNFHNKSHSYFRSHFYNHSNRRYYNRANKCNDNAQRRQQQYDYHHHQHYYRQHQQRNQSCKDNKNQSNPKLFLSLKNTFYKFIQNPMISYYLVDLKCKDFKKYYHSNLRFNSKPYYNNYDNEDINNVETSTNTNTTTNTTTATNTNTNYNTTATATTAATTAATTTTTTTTSDVNKKNRNFNMSTTILLQNTSNRVGDQFRHFSGSAPQMFILSKAARIFVPIAMSGVRKHMKSMSLFKRISLIILILASATGGYLALNHDEAPVTGRSRVVSYSKKEEQDLGEMGYEEMKTQLSDYFLPENNALQNRVREVAKRIIDVTDRPDLAWECHVVNSEVVNACVLPNGKIFVFSKLFDICESEDELASVISHEIGHAVARHAAEHLSISKLGYMFLTLTRGLVGETITGNLTTMFSANLLNLRYSRIQEIEADAIGLEFMVKANYNPYAALSVQKKLQQYTIKNDSILMGTTSSTSIQSQSMVVDFLSTHPSPEERIHKIEKWLDRNASRFKGLPIPMITSSNNYNNNNYNNNNNNNNNENNTPRISSSFISNKKLPEI
ncbi:hypothetical protein ACTFIY_001747 [Dictyostelium cf. discoideum]